MNSGTNRSVDREVCRWKHRTAGTSPEFRRSRDAGAMMRNPSMEIALKLLAPVFALAVVVAAPFSETATAADAASAAAAEAGAVVTPSGLVYRSLKEGSGATPAASDTVKVTYRGTFPDGKEFDSSGSTPIEFPLNKVIKCWTEGVQRMKVGGKAKLTCPASIAYGESGAGGVIPPNATLLFEVELIAIRH